MDKTINYIKTKLEEAKKKNGEDKNLRLIEDSLISVERDIVPLANKINEKTKYYYVEPAQDTNDGNNVNLPEGSLLVQDLANNEEVLGERREQLEAIHQTSAKIKDMTDSMVKQINDQGAILEEVEANVITTEENAKKAKEEITKANELSKGNRKKMCCFIAIIMIAVLAITAILLSLILG